VPLRDAPAAKLLRNRGRGAPFANGNRSYSKGDVKRATLALRQVSVVPP